MMMIYLIKDLILSIIPSAMLMDLEEHSDSDCHGDSQGTSREFSN